MSAAARQAVFSFAVAIVGVLLTAAIRFALRGLLHEPAPFIPFVIRVMVAGCMGGLRPGLLATFLGATLGAYLFAGPPFSLRIEQWSEAAALSIFTVVGITVSVLCEA